MHAQAFVGSRGGGGGGGGVTILYKTFPNFYIFHCKNDCLNPKFNLDSLAIKNKK